jgi:hypothetical protein
MLTVNPSVPAQTVHDLVAVIRATPGKYSYASGGGIGSPGYLVGEQFRLSLGLDLVQVSFSGANLAAGSVVAGHTPIGFVGGSAAVSLVKDGKLRALAGIRQDAVSGAARCPHHGRGRLSGHRGSGTDDPACPRRRQLFQEAADAISCHSGRQCVLAGGPPSAPGCPPEPHKRPLARFPDRAAPRPLPQSTDGPQAASRALPGSGCREADITKGSMPWAFIWKQ